MIKNIRELYLSQNASSEDLEGSAKAEDFETLPLKGTVEYSGELFRVDEGISLAFDEIRATQASPCIRCSKPLETPIHFEGGEWLFYENLPRDYDDLNELMRINRSKMEINLQNALRQEIELHLNRHPVCEPKCIEFDEPEQGVKALKGIKDILPCNSHENQ